MNEIKLSSGPLASSIRWHIKKRRLRFPPFKLRSKIHLVPHLFTLGNAFFGFCSIALAAHAYFVGAAYLILLGAFLDALDGRVARYLNQTSEFGMQLDSLCDAISFCCAPAFLVYFWQLKQVGFYGFFASACFLLAGLLRLARFNVSHVQQSTYFIGMPTTLAGCFLSVILLNIAKPMFAFTSLSLLALLVLTLSFLMISNVPFPTFKKKRLSNYFLALGLLCTFVILLMVGPAKLFLLIFMVYFFLICFNRIINEG